MPVKKPAGYSTTVLLSNAVLGLILTPLGSSLQPLRGCASPRRWGSCLMKKISARKRRVA